MMTRKDLLIKSAYTAGALFAVNGILPGLSYLEKVFAEDNSSPLNISERDHFLLRHASLAPSGHNTQPWRVKIVSDNEWIIGWDKSRSLPAVDPRNRELLLSIGTFCEALSIAAKSIGLECVKEVTAKNAFNSELVKITFKTSTASNEKMHALTRRRTIKNGFLADEIIPDHINLNTGDLKSKVYAFTKSSREAGLIEKAVLESNRTQAWRDEAQSELADWIRWSDKDANKHRNGLTPAGMEINGLAALYVKNFFNRDDVLSESFRNQTVELTEKYLSSYGSWIILSTDAENPETLVETGGDFLKLGLKAYNKKIALHPMTQPLEEKGFQEALQRDLKIKGKMQFILRAGYVKNYPDPATLRMPVERIVY